mgnify:CR=1 FL=1
MYLVDGVQAAPAATAEQSEKSEEVQCVVSCIRLSYPYKLIKITNLTDDAKLLMTEGVQSDNPECFLK